MVRHYTRKTDHQQWTKEAMKKAVQKVREKEMCLKEAATTYGIPKTTLFRRVKKEGEEVAKKGLGRYRPVFNRQQESDLEEYLLFMENRLFGLTFTDFRQLSFQFAVRNNVEHPFNLELKMAGIDYVYGFMKRHPNLSLRSPEATSAARAAGFNRVEVADFFGLLDTLREPQFPSKSDLQQRRNWSNDSPKQDLKGHIKEREKTGRFALVGRKGDTCHCRDLLQRIG